MGCFDISGQDAPCTFGGPLGVEGAGRWASEARHFLKWRKLVMRLFRWEGEWSKRGVSGGSVLSCVAAHAVAMGTSRTSWSQGADGDTRARDSGQAGLALRICVVRGDVIDGFVTVTDFFIFECLRLNKENKNHTGPV